MPDNETKSEQDPIWNMENTVKFDIDATPGAFKDSIPSLRADGHKIIDEACDKLLEGDESYEFTVIGVYNHGNNTETVGMAGIITPESLLRQALMVGVKAGYTPALVFSNMMATAEALYARYKSAETDSDDGVTFN